jgi:hypothetical protein
MNYHRRTTRPDAMYYRDQRKVPRGGRTSHGQGVSPMMIVILVGLLATAAFFLLRH